MRTGRQVKSAGIAVVLLSALLAIGSAAAWENGVFVEVTRLMVACTAVNDDPSLKVLLLAYLSTKPKPSALPERCRILEPGRSSSSTENRPKRTRGLS
jgi:hypothetical protein